LLTTKGLQRFWPVHQAKDSAMTTSQIKNDKGIDPPKHGETFRCGGCGMELKITKDCGCKDKEHVHFHCCGQEMTKA
jgi:hypothetical protein